ncbi:unnamed protein product [Closterium sp. NIES-54]
MLNLGVHAHLLHPLPVEDEAGQPYSSDADAAEAERGAVRRAAAVTMFEEWLLGLLCDMALYLVQVEESDESVWAAALSCLLYLTCDRGRTVFHRLALLDVRGGQLMVLYRQLAQLEQGEAGEEGGGGGGMGMGIGGGAGGGGGGGGGRRAGVSGAVQLMLELVRSDNTAVRRGFVTVLEQLLLLHAAETEQESRESRGAAHAAAAAAAEAPEGPMGMEERRAADEAAAAASAVQHQGAQDLLAVMSSALWQVMSCNDSDRVNILQMCSVMLWQLCVPRFLPTAQVVEPGSPVPSPGGSSWLVNPRVAAVAGGEGGGAMSPPYAAEESESMARLFLLRRAAAARELLAALPTALLYWPLMQLAPSAGDPIALATAVGSHGIVGAGGAVDVRVALLLLLIGKCSDSSEALEEVGGDAFFRSLLDDPDARIAYWSAAFLVKRMMSQQPDVYRRALHRLIFTAQQTNNEKLLENPYLQMRGILQDTPDALHLTS